MGTLTWTPAQLSWVSVLSAELSTMGTEAFVVGSASSSIIDNRTGTPNTRVIFEYSPVSPHQVAAGGTIVLFVVPERSSQNDVFAVSSGTINNNNNENIDFPRTHLALRAGTSVSGSYMSRPIVIAPGKYQMAVANYCGFGLGAGGANIKYALFSGNEV